GFGAFGRDFARSWNGEPEPAPAPAPVGPQVKFINAPGGMGSGVNVHDTVAQDQEFAARARELQRERMSPDEQALQDAAVAQRGGGTSQEQAVLYAQEMGIPVEQAMAALTAQVRTPSRANPMRPIVEKSAADQATALDAQGQAMQDGADAQHAQGVGMADLMEDQNRRLEAAAIDMQAKQFAQAEAAQEEYDAVQASARSVAEAVQRFQDAPDVDRGRFWASQSAGHQAKFAVTGLLAGFAGMPSILEQRIQQDIDAQKFNRQQRASEVDAATAGYNAAHSAYDALLEMHGDERIADEAYRVARMTAMESEIAAEAQRLGIPLNDAKIQQQIAEFAQKRAAAQQMLDTMVAKTPRRIGGGVRNVIQDKDVRAALLDQVKQGGRNQADMAKLSVEERGRNDRESVKDQRARDKSAADAELRGRESRQRNQFDQRKFIAKETADFRNELKHWEDFETRYGGRDGDIPGVSSLPLGSTLGTHQVTADAREARALMERGVKIRLRKESGAGIPEEEIQREAKTIVDAMSEEDIWRDVENRKAEARRMIDLFERAPDSSEVQQYLQAVQPDRDPIVSGNVADPTVVD
ncbi:MAG: hypothetical protein ACPGWS_08895, partial [Solirubrobacterales bacterium]